MESIGAQVWLVAYDVAKGGPRGGRRLAHAIAGGLLCDLLLRGKIRTDGERCRLVDSSPLGRPALDDLLGQIAAEQDRPRTWLSWVRGYARDAQGAVVEELELHGRLVRYERRLLGVLALPRHSLADPPRVERLRSSIRHALASPLGTPCEPRLAALAVLLNTAGFGPGPGPAGPGQLPATVRADELDSELPTGLRAVLAAVRAARTDAIAPAGAVG